MNCSVLQICYENNELFVLFFIEDGATQSAETALY